eukprot:scaffold16612_cov109-Skeletonema_dohrnii-CCMP3373.AAC.6
MEEINAPACVGMNILEKVLIHLHKGGNYFQKWHVCVQYRNNCVVSLTIRFPSDVEDTIRI